MDTSPAPKLSNKPIERADQMQFKCNMCTESFRIKSDYMKHRKDEHQEINPKCQNFLQGKCMRSESQCWYNHSNFSKRKTSDKQVFQNATLPSAPPDDLASIISMMNNLCTKVSNKIL